MARKACQSTHIPGNGYFDKPFVLTIEPKRV
jgi:hypothetical protein